MNYRPKHFILQELVGPDVFAERGERAWELLQPAALVSLDKLRRKFGPVTVNNWHAGGQYQESGLRTSRSLTGAKWSMHRFGGADDCKFRDATPQEVYDYVLLHPDEFPEITAMENIIATPTWLHQDCRNHNREGIWIVNP